ncbi:MAG: hypothetical protein HYY84_16370 [Deltaproteobacteria bacterium]|nr:hypothetical protein [Deltaproteobacteria bacterium]
MNQFRGAKRWAMLVVVALSAGACGVGADGLPGNTFADEDDDAFGLADADKADGARSWKRVWENTKKKVRDRVDEAKERAEAVYDQMLSFWERGVDYATAHPDEIWAKIRALDCKTVVEGLSRYNPASRFLANFSAPAATCADQFTVGFVCGTSQMMQALKTVAVGSIRAAWQHRPACFRTALLSGPLGPAGFAMCGLYYYSKPQVIKMAKCAKQLYQENRLWRALWEELWKTGCELAGQITLDVVMTALAGGGGAPAMIGSWFFKIKRMISPIAWLRAAGPVAHHSVEAVAHSLINASERLSECRDE